MASADLTVAAQRLKPRQWRLQTARLKPCPSQSLFLKQALCSPPWQITSVFALDYSCSIPKELTPPYDGIDMSQNVKEGGERRRDPRFRCGGRAIIRCLPSDGMVVPGKLYNLSVSGICVETAYPIDLGARAEILVSVNAASFRTVGVVKAIAERSRACMEFVQISANGKEILADLIGEFTRIQAVMKNLRSARQTEPELARELEAAGVRAALLGRISSIPRLPDSGSDEDPGARAGSGSDVELVPMVIKVDLFG